ncbi:unnamed protein product [Allacma fusca]|uniref:limulus clotting factor C n=1 Tax=Allacma fusca TaxID=39272 RepID=A0A8J2L9E4_9HEXA|nr:unnamed protein product [Allacma fusca]
MVFKTRTSNLSLLPDFAQISLVLILCFALCNSGAAENGKIVGGHEAPKNGYPSAVPLYYLAYPGCAATIVHQEWLVSAAHCVSGTVGHHTFTAGDHNLAIREDTEQNVTAIEAYAHKQFNRSTFHNDIALFKISPPLQLNKYVQKAVMPSPDFNPKGIATPVGWGATENQSISVVLMEVDVPLITNEECREAYPEKIFDSSICAVAIEGGKDACKGDSGGPLYFKQDGKQILIGIVSNGRGCGNKKYPGVYTRVSKFLGWMKEITGIDFTAPGDNSRGKVGTGGNRKGKIITILAESVCNQYQQYLKDKKILTPVKKMPQSSRTKPGWLVWKKCSARSCNSFKFVH